MSVKKIISAGIKAVKASRKAKQPKHSFSSMSPIDKAFTAAKVTGRAMNTFTRNSKSRIDPSSKKFINTMYGVAGASQLIPNVRKKK